MSSAPAAAKPEKKKSDFVVPPKKPKLSKAERRALQEAQRAAKVGGGPPPKQDASSKPEEVVDLSSTATVATTGSPAAAAAHDAAKQKSKQISLLSHLPPYRDPRDYPAQFLGIQLGGDSDEYKQLHPAVLAAGRAYAMGGTIRGGNTRCRLMLDALSQAMEDYVPTKGCKDVRHDILNVVLKPSFAYWTHHCRPHSTSMGNAFSFVKSAVAALDRDLAQQWSSEGPCEAKSLLQESMEAYVQERIHYADQAIAHYVSDKSIIQDGDVILTYGNYEVIAHVLIEAARRKTNFRVICVDSKPLLEGQLLVRALREEDDTIDCTYILLNALSFVMKDVTKVLLGAEALMNDGSVYARVGTACVASCCMKKNKAVLVCAETYKISHRVQLEAITNNELGNPKDVLADSDDGDDDNLRVIPLLYDLTPADFISAIVTEMGILPPTSVAVLLREMNPDAAANTLGGF